MGRPRKSVNVPMEIWLAKNLSWKEKVLLIEIDSLTSRGRECYFSNSYIAEFLDIKEDTASRLINSLIKKGYVRQTRFDGRQRYVESCLETQGRLGLISEADSDEALDLNPGQTRTEIQHTSINNNNKKLRKEIYKEKKKIFSPPTNQMIIDYSRQRGFADPEGFAEHFLAYYSEGEHPWHLSNGKPMKDWKRAVITWETNNKSRRFSASNQPQQSQLPQQATSDAFQKFMQ